MMNQLAVFVVILMLIVGIVGCMAMAGSALGDEDAPSPIYSPTTEPSSIEVERAEAEARALEAQEAIAKAEAARIRAEGDRERARAAAHVERELGDAAARAIDRQGRLLTAYIVAGQGKTFGIGLLVGIALTGVAIAVAIEYRRVSSREEQSDNEMPEVRS